MVNLDRPATRTRQVISRLKELGFEGVTLWLAKDYWVFSGGIADYFEAQGVYTPRLSDMTVRQWTDAFKAKVEALPTHPNGRTRWSYKDGSPLPEWMPEESQARRDEIMAMGKK